MSEQPNRAGAVDRWDSGDAYELYVGRWSRLVAREFVWWLAVPPASRWLDVGCGTGALTKTVLEHAAPSEVVGIDPSAAYIASARVRTERSASPLRDRGCSNPTSNSSNLRCGRLRPGSQLRAPARASGSRNGACDTLRGNRRGLRLGLRRRYATDALLLGCGWCIGPEGKGTR